MAELKKKVTLKRKSEFVTSKSSNVKAKNKFLIPIIIVVLLIVTIGSYFLLKSDNLKDEPIVNNEKTTDTDKSKDVNPISDTTVQEQIKAIEQPTETKSSEVSPYQKGVSYEVYLFPFGMSDYSQPNPELDKLVEVMKKNPNMKISIFAYTDNVGSANFNQILSDKRAKAIRDYIISKSIEINRIAYLGKGISMKYPTDVENRRAEFVLSE